MITKKNVIPFLVGLLVGLLIIGLFFLTSDKMDASRSTSIEKIDEYDPVRTGWSKDFGTLNLDPIKPFLISENIKIVTFINENGGFLVANVRGEEISGWHQMDGTKVEGAFSEIKDGSKLVNFNQMTIFATQASPQVEYIKIDGYSVAVVVEPD